MQKAKFGQTQERRNWKRRRRVAVRIILGLLVVGLMTWLFPTRKTQEFSDLKEGMISDREVIAPFDFPIRKSETELARDREEAKNRVLPVLRYDESVEGAAMADFDSLFADVIRTAASDARFLRGTVSEKSSAWKLYEPTVRFLIKKGTNRREAESFAYVSKESLRDLYAVGMLQNKKDLEDKSENVVTVVKGTQETQVPLGEIMDLTQAKEALSERIRKETFEEGAINAHYELAASLLSPNLIHDSAESQRRKQAAADRVGMYKGMIYKNYRLLDSHEQITPEQIDMLHSLDRANAEKKLEEQIWLRYLLPVDRALVSAALLALLIGYLYVFRRAVYERDGLLILLSMLLFLPTSVASYATQHGGISEFLIPVALSAMLATVLFDAEVALILTMVSALFVGAISGYFGEVLVALLCGAGAVFMVRNIHHRHQFYRAMILLPLCYALTTVATELLRLGKLEGLHEGLFWGAINGFTSCVLTIGLLPIFETVFGITTNLTLVELSDLNRPLLRELALRAPGTHHHTIVVGTLAENAAEAIGANPLLARVGGYYHDIGKMAKPEYYVENQTSGRNPHDRLTPTMSALVILSHVKEGLEMADRYGLPLAVTDFIPQHHGSALTPFFYHRAMEAGGRVEEASFRYPGPRPKTREAAVVMLADSCEAAVRSLEERTPSRIKGMVRSVIQGKLKEEQLDDCDLTLQDLSRIEESFIPILMAVGHARVPYPQGTRQKTKRI
ncbi:MAG: HDIG domain-containing metalloprotein [Candidatus Latescibacterota bacterium]